MLAPTHRRIDCGLGQELVLPLPLSPAEVAGRLGVLAQTKWLTRRPLKEQDDRPFFGQVRPPTFHLRPTGQMRSLLSVNGTIRDHGSGSVLTLRVGFPVGMAIFLAVATVSFAVMIALINRSAGTVLFYTMAIVGFSIATILGGFVAVRYGVGHVMRLLVASLEPDFDPSSAPSLETSLPSADELFRRMEEWDEKHR